MQGSTDQLYWQQAGVFPSKNVIVKERTVQVRNDPLELDDIEAMHTMRALEERVLQTAHTRTSSNSSRGQEHESLGLEFESKPEGWPEMPEK